MTLEERVTALESLVETLTNESASYATSKYSVEEMDALLDKVSAM